MLGGRGWREGRYLGRLVWESKGYLARDTTRCGGGRRCCRVSGGRSERRRSVACSSPPAAGFQRTDALVERERAAERRVDAMRCATLAQGSLRLLAAAVRSARCYKYVSGG